MSPHYRQRHQLHPKREVDFNRQVKQEPEPDEQIPGSPATSIRKCQKAEPAWYSGYSAPTPLWKKYIENICNYVNIIYM